jgi:hypothetical protein
MPIHIREPVAIRGAAVLVFHWLVSAAVGAKIPIIHVQDPSACPHADLELERSRKTIAKQGSCSASRVR